MLRTLLHAIAALGVLAAPVAMTAQSSDLFYGTRTLDRAKSTYSPGPGPSGGSLKVTMARAEGGFKMIGDSVSADGKATHNEVFATFDGKEHPMGTDGKATIAFRKIDDMHYERIDKFEGKVTTTSKITVSDGGKTHTMVQTGKNRKGEPMNNVLVFTR